MVVQLPCLTLFLKKGGGIVKKHLNGLTFLTFKHKVPSLFYEKQFKHFFRKLYFYIPMGQNF